MLPGNLLGVEHVYSIRTLYTNGVIVLRQAHVSVQEVLHKVCVCRLRLHSSHLLLIAFRVLEHGPHHEAAAVSRYQVCQ